MKKLLTVLILLSLVSQTYAIDWDKQQRTRQELEKQLFYDFCDGMRENRKCDVPSPWDGEFWGVCCNEQCNGYTNDCSKPGFGGPSLLDVIVNMPCTDKKQGEECDIPQEIEKEYDAWGVCCNRQCVYMEERCDEGFNSDMDNKDYSSENRNIEKELEALTTLTCMGVPDGEKCQIQDEQLIKLINLYGVCCNGKCHWRSTKCPAETEDMKPDLVIIEMETHPEDLSKTLQIDNVTITIKNQGAASTGKSFWIEFRKGDGSSPITREVSSLDAGEDATVVLDGIPPYQQQRRYLMEASIDLNPNSVKSNLVDESDETNNKATVEVFVGENMEACGDGLCDEGEEKTCQRDCMTERFCGDGLCEEMERGSCFEDCGRCGDGNCDEGEKEGCPEDCESTDGKSPVFLLLLFAVIILIIALAAFFFFSRKKAKGPLIDYELQIQRLLKEKKTIEEMIELAKAKYHKRKLDEESFREIVKENQKKLIEIETRITNIEEMVEKKK